MRFLHSDGLSCARYRVDTSAAGVVDRAQILAQNVDSETG